MFTTLQRKTGDIAGALAVLSPALRHIVQSGMLALGTYLAIQREMTSDMIVAASIIVARAVQPVELVIANVRCRRPGRHGGGFKKS